MEKKFNAYLGGGILAMTMATASQGQTPSAESSPADGSLQEIIVTAEKRSQDIQKIPVAITALSGDAIEERGIKGIADVQYNVPGMSVSNTGVIPLINIRGIGLTLVSPNTSSGIINYRDGVLITHEPFLIDAYYDQEQIEVLRGPQGTLTGSNSTGGAILVNSRSPVLGGERSGYLTQSFGDHDDFRTEGALTMPISADWAVRLAFNTENRNSYFTDQGAPGGTAIASNDAPGALSQQGFRVTLLGKPIDELNVLFKSEYNNNRGNGIPLSPTVYSPYYAYASHTPYVLNYNETDTLSRNTDWRSVLTLDWQFTSGAELRSQTSYFRGINRETDDGDASAFDGQKSSFEVDFDTFTQEFALISTGDSPLQYTAGTFFFNDKVDNKNFLITNLALPTGPLGPYQIIPFGNQKAMDIAAFGQIAYSILPGLQVYAGGRYTRNRRWEPDGSTRIIVTPVGPTLTLPFPLVYNRGVGTGKAGINWNLDTNNLLYAFVARGAKSGGYNNGSPTGPGPLYNPEYVTDYELGWKVTAFDDHLRAQLDGFYMNYRDFQLNQYDPLTQASNVANAARATIKGPEAQIEAVFGGLGIDGTAAYVKSELGAATLFDTRFTPAPSFNIDGNDLPYAPRWTTNLGVQYTIPFFGTLTPRIQYSYTSSQWTQVFQNATATYDPMRNYLVSRSLIDASMIWARDKTWKVELYGRNLANRAYVQAISSSATTDNAFYGNPRTYGVRATYEF